MSIISYALKVVSDEMLKVLKQSRKGFLSNLTKTINRAEMSIKNETNISEIALLREKVELSIFKLQKKSSHCIESFIDTLIEGSETITNTTID